MEDSYNVTVPMMRMSSLPTPPGLAPILEPSSEFEYWPTRRESSLSEMSLDAVPIRELTGLAATFGIEQNDCYEAADLRRKIEEKRRSLVQQQKTLHSLKPFLISCIDSGAGVIDDFD